MMAMYVCIPTHVQAQDQAPEDNQQVEHVYLEKSIVRNVASSTTEVEPWSGVTSPTQSITIEILEGHDKGITKTIKNDYAQLKQGDVFYVRHSVGGFGLETWAVADPYRLNVLIGVAIAFVLLLLFFGGLQGIRGLLSLLGSIALIFYVLIPNIYAGHSPILISIGVASLIIIVGSYVTHGFNRTTTMAMLGMILTVLVVGVATYFLIHAAQLSGYTTEESAYLNLNTHGRINLIGLLFGGIMIGLLGVLYDIAIGQAITVEELITAGQHYTRKQVFSRAMRVGREHIGALVNTLAIAYVGASLPLLLLFYKSTDTGIAYVLNSELFATEILRILMGSIGLVIAVPITTLLATHFLYGRKLHKSSGQETHHHH
jgi:uncharacterized membrane protein